MSSNKIFTNNMGVSEIIEEDELNFKDRENSYYQKIYVNSGQKTLYH